MRLTGALAGTARCRRRARARDCCIAAELAPGLDAKAIADECLDARARPQRGHAHVAAPRAAVARDRRRDRRGRRRPRPRCSPTRASGRSTVVSVHPPVPRGRRPHAGPVRRAARSRRDVEAQARRPCPPRSTAGAVALLFEKPSARTRVSTELAVQSLGGYPVVLRGEEVDLDESRIRRGRRPHPRRLLLGDRGPRVRPRARSSR